MKVLLLGDSGFIGNHIKKELQSNDIEVIGFDIKNDITQDVINQDAILKLPVCDVIVWAVGILGPETIYNPKLSLYVNTLGILNVLERIKETKERLVKMSLPRIKWFNSYSITQHCGDDFCKMYENCFSAFVSYVRPHDVYGPGQYFTETEKLTASTVYRIMTGQKVRIYGDGEQLVNPVYVGDVAKLVRKVILRDSVDIEFGSEQSITVNDWVALIGQVMGKKVEIEYFDRRISEGSRYEVKPSKSDMEKLQQYNLTRTSWFDGLTETVKWWENNA